MDVLAGRVARRFTLRTAFERTIVAFGLKDLAQLSKRGRSFGVMSAYRSNLSKHENQERHGELIADLQKMGYRNVGDLKSQWADIATNVTHKEKSIYIPRIPFKALCRLGKEYDQDAVVYKDPSDTIGVYNKYGKAVMAFDAEGKMAMQHSLERSKEYSRGRSVSFGLMLVDDYEFPYGGYDGGKPVTIDQIAKYLEATS